jgi:hypothetical protein
MSFAEATVLDPAGDGEFGWDVPDGWQQGRGAWGGLVAAGIVRAVQATDATRPLRTLSLHLSAPVGVGAATVHVEPVRVGSALSTWQATVESAPGESAPGETAAHAVAITGSPRAHDLHDVARGWGRAVPPDLPPWDTVAPIPHGLSGMPTFLQHVDLRVVHGSVIAADEAHAAGFVGFAEPDGWDAAGLLAIVDAWWPTAFVGMDAMRPVATVSYVAHLLVDPVTVEPDVPLAYEASLSAAHDGFTAETRRLWTLDGRLAVENHQSIVIIR